MSNKKISFKKLSEFQHKSREYDLIITDNLFETERSDNTKFVDVLSLFADHYLRLSSTKVVISGNVLSKRSFVMSMQSVIDHLDMDVCFFHYPLFDDKGKCLWKNKYDKDLLKTIKLEMSNNDFKKLYLHQMEDKHKVATWQYEYIQKYDVDLITASILAFSTYKKESQIFVAIKSLTKDKKIISKMPQHKFKNYTISFPKNKDTYYV